MDGVEHQRILDIIWQKDQAPLDLPATSTALLVIDVQRCFIDLGENFPQVLERLAPGATTGYFDRVQRLVLPNIVRLLGAFRSVRAPVVFTGTGTIDGTGGDLVGWLRGFDMLGRHLLGEAVWPHVDAPAWAIDPSVAPLPSEAVLAKRTADPFLSTELDAHLKRLGVSAVVVCGLTTDVCVAATARAAADRGYDAVVAADACATLSEAMHRASLEAIALAFGRVKPTEDVLRLLAAPEPERDATPAIPPSPVRGNRA